MLCALGFPLKQQERAGPKATLLKWHPGSCWKIVIASQNGNRYQINKNHLQNLGESKKWEAVGGGVKTGFQTLAVQSATAVLEVGWDHSNTMWYFVGFSLRGCTWEA